MPNRQVQKQKDIGQTNAVVVQNLAKRFGDFLALDDINLSIKDNEFFTLLGPSGCGKTTLLRTIAGFETASAGKVILFGKDIADLPPHKRPVNTVFQQYALFPHMDVTQNVGFGLKMLGWSKADIEKKVSDVLALVQLTSFANRLPSQLSGGQQQRVALARALAPNPKVLLLDEPLSALDLKLRQAVRLELQQIQNETGITFIFVTHDQEEALTMSDRIAVFSQGKLQQVGTAQQVYEAPVNQFVADFIGETNFIKVQVEKLDQHTASCRLPGGDVLTCSCPAGAQKGAGHISVRPEKIFVTSSEKAKLAGNVVRLIYSGTDTHIHIKLEDGLELKARVQNASNNALPQVGEKVGVDFEEGAARLLVV